MANLSNINGKFVVDTAGNIGVGTLIPRSDANTTNISIQSSGTARLFVNNTGASGKEYAIYSSANGDFGIFDYGAVSARLVIDSSGNSTFAGDVTINGFFTSQGIDDNANATAITINGNEEVGIGTLTPFYKLDVNGTFRASGNATFGGNVSITKASTPELILTDTTNNVNLLIAVDDANTFLRSSSGAPILFQTNAGTTALTLDASQNATFAGNVKVNLTSSVAGALSVFDADGNTIWLKGRSSDGESSVSFRNNADSAYNGRIATTDTLMKFSQASDYTFDGNVGIGTTSPNKRLTIGGVNATEGVNLYTKVGSTLYKLWEAEQYFSDEGYQGMYYQNVKKIQFRTNGDSYFSGGNVGIGTTSPNYKLEVNGTTKATSSYHQNVNFTNTPTFQIGTDAFSSGFFVYDSTAAAYRMVVKSSTGNVGIGTTSPWTKLAVSGTTASANPITKFTNSNTSWTTILTFTSGTAYSVLLATSENNFSQMWRVSGSVPQQTCYYTLLGDSGHTHSKDVEFRISSSALQFKNVVYTTGRYLYAFDVVQSSGTFTY
jgi:hypothetical protein